MPTVTLRADCAQCAALCCVALAFDKSDLFAYDKRAGEPCRHLDGRGGCRIHRAREKQGFAGCASYDCLGAGQFVTQIVFGGRSWRDDPTLLEPMIRAFSQVRDLHGLLLLLQYAGGFALPDLMHRKREDFARDLRLDGATTMRDVFDATLALRMREAKRFLASLRPFLLGRGRVPEAFVSSPAPPRTAPPV